MKTNSIIVVFYLSMFYISCINASKNISSYNSKESFCIDSAVYSGWIGDYVTDSLFVDSSEGLLSSDGTFIPDVVFAQFKLSIRLDVSHFSLYKQGNIGAEYKTFHYLAKTRIIDDTLFLTTLEDIYNWNSDYENFKPINRPVIKLFRNGNKILATSINYKKKVPLFFNKEVKEENAKAEAYNKRLEQEKQKIAQNPVKEPSLQHKQVLDKYIESAAKCKITIDNTAPRQEKERNRLEQLKVTKEDNKEQVQRHDRSRGYRR